MMPASALSNSSTLVLPDLFIYAVLQNEPEVEQIPSRTDNGYTDERGCVGDGGVPDSRLDEW